MDARKQRRWSRHANDLYRLYQLNKQAAAIRILPAYVDDSGYQVGALEFVGIGGLIRLEVYCTATQVVLLEIRNCQFRPTRLA